jgi:hypothetical protein
VTGNVTGAWASQGLVALVGTLDEIETALPVRSHTVMEALPIGSCIQQNSQRWMKMEDGRWFAVDRLNAPLRDRGDYRSQQFSIADSLVVKKVAVA